MAFDDYVALVLQCTEIARMTISSDVKLERQSIITKMRGLLDPKMKAEVDYEEASKDVSNVWLQWSTGEAAGKRAFIPTIEDRDQCYAALQIFCHAADEAKIISQEFCKEFGDPGIGLYNELVSMICEKDKNCLPFVNMCLRTWIEHLRDDPDLWANTYQFDFDKWVVEKMGEPMSTHCGGKTSYKLMMFVFGKEQGKLPQNTIERPNTDRPTANFTMPEGIPSAKLSSRTSSKSRSSKIKKIGDMVKRRLIKSNELRGKYRYTRRANDEIKAAIAEIEEDDLNKYAMRSCREAARKMEEILFTAGGAKRIVTTLRYFRERPGVRELGQAKVILDGGKTGKYSTKEERLQSLVMGGLRDFFAMFHRPRSEDNKGGGRRSLEDQNAYDAILTALNSNDLTSAKLGRMLTRTLNVSHRQIKRGRAFRKDMEDMDRARWICRTSSVPKNAIKEGKLKC